MPGSGFSLSAARDHRFVRRVYLSLVTANGPALKTVQCQARSSWRSFRSNAWRLQSRRGNGHSLSSAGPIGAAALALDRKPRVAETVGLLNWEITMTARRHLFATAIALLTLPGAAAAGRGG